MSLSKYNAKRDFRQTSEPEGKAAKGHKELSFVVHRHNASHLHWDFRLELDGVLKSWAVPKGPSLNPKDRRLAVQVEDHPLSYGSFEGDIPEGNYGAGHVDIWDHGTYDPVDETGEPISQAQALRDWEKGHMRFHIRGSKLKGSFQVFQMGDNGKNWLLLKGKDAYAIDAKYDPDDAGTAEKAADVPAVKTKTKPAPTVEKPDKLSHFITPMMAVLHDGPFDDPQWLFEIKWDGYRAIAECAGESSRLYSRNGLDFSERYPDVFKAISGFSADMILDGEIVAFNDKANPDFQLLQNAGSNAAELLYYVFDILRLNGESLESLPLADRKELLKKALPENNAVRYSDHVVGDGKDFFKVMEKRGLEGMMAKKCTSLYVEGARTPEWRKVKHIITDEAVITGYTEPRGARKYFGALILGEYRNGKLEYIGHAGTGFNAKTLMSLHETMQSYRQDASPFDKRIPVNSPVTWLRPELVANIKFSEITKDGIRRHPVFMGLRDDKAARDVNRADAQPVSEPNTESTPNMDENTISVGGHTVTLTNLDKVYWPDEGYTKGELVLYYESVSKYVLPYLKGRALSLLRNPNGIRDHGFFHKDAGNDAPDWVDTQVIRSEHPDRDVNYILANNKATLLYLANLGCIELNPWHSKADNLEHPDYMVIDLDPSDKNTFNDVIETAKAVKQVMDGAGIDSYVKTSGSTGLHIYVPLAHKYHYDQVLQFAEIIAMRTQELLPDLTSLERSLKKRGDMIYIDYMQNRIGQTVAAPYSVRPRPHATVSTPLEWKEVRKGLDMQRFTIKTLAKRLEQKGDLFKPVLGRGIDMEKALKKLGG
jgi:bifunctional non-homologous end joining protein LigD